MRLLTNRVAGFLKIPFTRWFLYKIWSQKSIWNLEFKFVVRSAYNLQLAFKVAWSKVSCWWKYTTGVFSKSSLGNGYTIWTNIQLNHRFIILVLKSYKDVYTKTVKIKYKKLVAAKEKLIQKLCYIKTIVRNSNHFKRCLIPNLSTNKLRNGQETWTLYSDISMQSTLISSNFCADKQLTINVLW